MSYNAATLIVILIVCALAWAIKNHINHSTLIEQQRRALDQHRQKLEAANLLLLPLYHHAAHSYNKWTLQRDKSKTLNYSEALEELRQYGKKQFK